MAHRAVAVGLSPFEGPLLRRAFCLLGEGAKASAVSEFLELLCYPLGIRVSVRELPV